MKRVLKLANGAFAAAFLLAPVAIFACPAGSNSGIVAIDSNPGGDVKAADQPLTSDADNTYIHGFNVLDAEGTFSVVDGNKTLATGAWKATKAKSGNGFDFTAGPLQVPDGLHTVKVFDASGLSDKEASKTFNAHKKADPDRNEALAAANAGCGENNFASGELTPAAGQTAAAGSPISAVYRDETGLDMTPGRITFTLTGGAITQALTPVLTPMPAGQTKVVKIAATIPAALPNGTYTAFLKAYDTDQNKAGGDCGIARWTVVVGPGSTPTPTPVPTATPGNGHTSPGDNNRGDTWLQTVGPCPDRNAEQLNHNPNAFGNCNIVTTAGPAAVQPPFEPADEAAQNAEIGTVEDTNPNHTPHLPCANIEVMGKGMGDASGPYSIDVWPPTGDAAPVYGKDANGTSVLSGQMTAGDVGHNGTWTFDAAKHQYQVMDIVDVDALVHNADLAGAHEHPIQGYHFKLQFAQDPQKHKTFWVDCPSPSVPPVVTPPPGPCTTIAQALKSYSFSVNGGPAVQDLENNIHQGDHVSVTYATTGECSAQTFSLVSYTAPGATFDTATATQQQVFKFDTATVGVGSHTLAVDVPGCFFQVDFVKGSPILHLGATPNDFYSAQGRLIDATNGGTGSCASVTPPPPAPLLAIVKHVDKSQAVAPAPLTYTIEITNSGNGAATNVGVVDVLSPGTVQFEAPSHFFPSSGAVALSGGHYIWTIPAIAAGGSARLTFSILAKSAGTIANASSIGVPGEACLAPTCSQVHTVVTVPPAPSSITAVIYRQGTTAVVPGGSVQLQGVTTPTGAYPTTYSHLPAGSYCVQEMTPAGYSLNSATVAGTSAAMGSAGQVCFPVAIGQTVPVVYYVTQNNPQTPPTACVGEEFMLQGTNIVVPGGTVNLNGANPQSAPFTYCNLPLGSATGAPVLAPTSYTLVPGTAAITETLVQGANPTMIFYVNIPQAPAACGNVLGTIVLAGTNTMVPGGTITETGQAAVTSYPALLGPCSPAIAGVAVTMTPPTGYQVVGAVTVTAPIAAGQVTPVIFQVKPIAGGTQGTGDGQGQGPTDPGSTTGVLAATVQHAPTSGVLGTSIGMPITGSEAEGRIALSVVCVALGLFAVYKNRRRRGQL